MLENQTIGITGAAQGLGLAMARFFSTQGAKVILTDVQEEALAQAVASINDANPAHLAESHRLDVSNPDNVKAFAQTIEQKSWSITGWVNNAGILRDASLLKLEADAFDQVMDIHAKGTFLCTQMMGRHMKDHGQGGSVVNLSSVAYKGNFGQTNYSGAKAAIVGMTRTWALELSRYQIRVNAIAPGLIQTAMTDSIPEDVREQMVDKIPLKRMGQPEEIANLVAFLISKKASYIQGQTIHINGGFYI